MEIFTYNDFFRYEDILTSEIVICDLTTRTLALEKGE